MTVHDGKPAHEIRVSDGMAAAIALLAVLCWVGIEYVALPAAYKIGLGLARGQEARQPARGSPEPDPAPPPEPHPAAKWELGDGLTRETLDRHVAVSTKYVARVERALQENAHIPVVSRMWTYYRGRIRAMVYDPDSSEQPMTAVQPPEGNPDVISVIAFGEAGFRQPAVNGRPFRYSNLWRGVLVATMDCPEPWFQAGVLHELYYAYADSFAGQPAQQELLRAVGHHIAREVLDGKTAGKYGYKLAEITEANPDPRWDRFITRVMNEHNIGELDALFGQPRAEEARFRNEQYAMDLLTVWALKYGTQDQPEPQPNLHPVKLAVR